MRIINGRDVGDAYGRWARERIVACRRHIWTLNPRGDGPWSCTQCPARAVVR